MSEYEPIEYTLVGGHGNEKLLAQLENYLTFVQMALRTAGKPDVDVDKIYWKLSKDYESSTSSLILHIPKKCDCQCECKQKT